LKGIYGIIGDIETNIRWLTEILK